MYAQNLILSLVASAALFVTPTFGQLKTTSLAEGVTPQGLVEKLLGGGVTVFNVQYTGSNVASGVFCRGLEAVGFDNGILLTSGLAANVLGPNDASGKGESLSLPGDADLDLLIPGFETFDAVVLEFDFVTEGSQVQFNYVFASEEYNEFVNSSFNDVFGFFVNSVNYALLPGTVTPVSINNVNNGNAASGTASSGPCQNCDFYIDNVAGARNTQMDGLTTVLTFTAPVVPGQTNRLKIAIADAGDGILDSAVFLQAGSLRSGVNSNCVTRNARYWFTHYNGPDNCATLRAAMEIAIRTGCDSLDLGFVELPVGYRNDDSVRDFEDATIEALGLYWRSQGRTGEPTGTQSSKLPASSLCRERKRMAVEYIAALANIALFNLDPTKCTYRVGSTWVPFPADLVEQAVATLRGDDIVAVRNFTALLKKFNNSGILQPFPLALVECNGNKTKTLKTLARDPSSQVNCPGRNGSCETAEAVVFPASTSIFSTASYSRSLDLRTLVGFTESNLVCEVARPYGVWKIKSDIAQPGRRFSVNTRGSNFDTVISVTKGDCSDQVSVECGQNLSFGVNGELLQFTADGTNDYNVVVSGYNAAIGKLKVKITSP